MERMSIVRMLASACLSKRSELVCGLSGIGLNLPNAVSALGSTNIAAVVAPRV
jgi:hypothetical protein